MKLDRKVIQDFAFSADGTRLAVVSNEEMVRVWDTRTWEEGPVLSWGIGKLKCLAFSPDGTRAACGGHRGAILVWDWQ
ncbi:WD40 repeat domain-containing protein [Gemmata sp. SH-PL17]|uniref:WD40 repeat domain-containing protein n=1 Tax=Gemmata sp. SH-PL17 TaxID=1630693 RepID=UPI001EF501A3|nr:WD40 repeat domain-containing protein [Gemmata sp. SH-PL17]